MNVLFCLPAKQLFKCDVGCKDDAEPDDGRKCHLRVRKRNNEESAYHHKAVGGVKKVQAPQSDPSTIIRAVSRNSFGVAFIARSAAVARASFARRRMPDILTRIGSSGLFSFQCASTLRASIT